MYLYVNVYIYIYIYVYICIQFFIYGIISAMKIKNNDVVYVHNKIIFDYFYLLISSDTADSLAFL